MSKPFEKTREQWSKSQEVLSKVITVEAGRTAAVFLGEANRALEPFNIKKVIHVYFQQGILSLKWGGTTLFASGIIRSPRTRSRFANTGFPVVKVLMGILKELGTYNTDEDDAVLHALNGLPLN